MSRTYDLVLFGATGFTGELVAEYLAKRKLPQLRWAVAGRNLGKLKALRRKLYDIDPALGSLALLTADAANEAELRAVAEQASVVVTTVGPYTRYGLPLARACAEAGTDYCDLTGEVPFIREVIDGCHARAQETKARLVPSSGFDSIPSDLGVFLLHEHFDQRGSALARAKLVLGKSKGGISGGTAQSMVSLLEAASADRRVRRLLGDPYALSPQRNKDRGPDKGDAMGVGLDPTSGNWTAPFVMAGINTRVVRRTNALLDFPYGKDFRYEEVMGMGRGAAGLARAVGFTAGLGAFVALSANDLTRPLVTRFLPKSGEGPSKETREGGFFELRVFGWGSGEREPSAVCHVRGQADPGYGETAKMLSETALLLLSTRGTGPYGVLTPASALGSQLAARLRERGMRWDVETL